MARRNRCGSSSVLKSLVWPFLNRLRSLLDSSSHSIGCEWGGKAYVSGHSAQAPDGSFSGPFGKVPIEVSLEAAQQAAAKTALSILGSLKRTLGDLDRVTAWLMVYGMVNADPGYSQTTHAINGFSDLIVDLYGPEVGAHARVAVGMAALPLDNAVVIAAEVAVAD